MEQADYEALPATLSLREVRTQITKPGCRVKELVVVTTLLDPAAYPTEDILDLYHERWHVEVYQPEYASSARLYQLAA